MAPELVSSVPNDNGAVRPSLLGRKWKSLGKPLPNPSKEAFDRLSAKLRQEELPGVKWAESYLFHLYRKNRRPNTLEINYTAMRLFLQFLKAGGIAHLEGLERKHLEAFIEHEQDRGMKPLSVRGRLGSLRAFLRFLTEEGVVRHEVLSKPIAVKVPEALPRAMAPEDVRQLLGAIQGTRNRAMVLVLLRTGIRVGELLALRMQDIDLREQKVFISEVNKTGLGRVVYLSADAKEALAAWMREKDPREDVLFYGRVREMLTYAAARSMFVRCLKRAGLQEKGYTIHCLRHTFASELLNAGMRLECLQPLLGHTSIEVTRRYARLTDKTRKEEYFRAMGIVEKGDIHGSYRFDH